MSVKTATLIALIGVSLTYGLGLIDALSHGPKPMYLLRGALYNIPLILFFFTLYRKQG